MNKAISKFLLMIVISLITTQASYGQFDDKFYFPGKEWTPIEGMKYEEVSLLADKDTITGLFLKPKNNPLATIFFFHGGGGNNSTYIDMVRPFVKAGFQVFMIDFRGYGKSTGKPTHSNVATDGQFVFEYLLNRPDVKGTKMILYGASMGTQIATKLTKDNPGKVNVLVLDGTISSFTDIALAYAPEEQRAVIQQYVTSPYSAKEDIKHITIPKLLIHSKTDKDVPILQGETVFNNAIEPKELFIYEGEHLDAMRKCPEQVIEKVVKIIEIGK